MMKTIDMQDMRHLNLFSKVTNINTNFCVKYNDTIIFCVPKNLLMRAVGENARNIRTLSDIIRKKVRVIPCPRGIQDAKPFIEQIIRPVTFKDMQITNNEIVITAGIMNKAALIGREKRRLLELQKIAKDYFGKELRII